MSSARTTLRRTGPCTCKPPVGQDELISIRTKKNLHAASGSSSSKKKGNRQKKVYLGFHESRCSSRHLGAAGAVCQVRGTQRPPWAQHHHPIPNALGDPSGSLSWARCSSCSGRTRWFSPATAAAPFSDLGFNPSPALAGREPLPPPPRPWRWAATLPGRGPDPGSKGERGGAAAAVRLAGRTAEPVFGLEPDGRRTLETPVSAEEEAAGESLSGSLTSETLSGAWAGRNRNARPVPREGEAPRPALGNTSRLGRAVPLLREVGP